MKTLYGLMALILLINVERLYASSILDSIHRERDEKLNIEYVWIEDLKFPRFSMTVYFNEGAINDEIAGQTQATLELLTSGTKKQSQKELIEFFDFYGVNSKQSATHEYSIYGIQGLIKDADLLVSKVCELYADADYPDKERVSYTERQSSQLKNLVTSHSQLADRAFRKLSLAATPYEQSVEGTLEGWGKLSQKHLKDKLLKLNNSYKTVYLTGPREVLKIKKIISEKCPWKSEKKLSSLKLSKPSSQSVVYLVPVEGANQAQIRIGRYITPSEIEGKYDQFQFLSGYLGGGFTSKLVQELRVKRGLTYSAGAYVSMQRDYGRVGMMTFTKNETAAEVISLVRDIFQDVSQGKISAEEFKHHQNHQIGGFAFAFEETHSLISQLALFEHQGRLLDELVNFPISLRKFTVSTLAQASVEIFPWERLTIVVVGDKKLEQALSRIRPVKIIDLKEFL